MKRSMPLHISGASKSPNRLVDCHAYRDVPTALRWVILLRLTRRDAMGCHIAPLWG